MKKHTARAASFILAAVTVLFCLASCGGLKSQYDSYDRTGESYDYDLTEYVAIPDYRGIEVPDISYTPSAEEIADTRVLKQAYFTPEERVNEPCAKYDLIDCAYSCEVEGVNYKRFDSTVDNSRTSVMVGIGNFGVPAIDDAIIGMKPGDEKTIEFTFPEPYLKDIAASGKSGTFKIKVEHVRRMDFGEDFSDYTDEFVQDHFGYDSVDEYDEEIKTQLTHDMEQCFEGYETELAWEYIYDNALVYKYPGKELNDVRDNAVAAYSQGAQTADMSFEEYVKSLGYKDNADFYDNYVEPYARTTVKEAMILMLIARCEHLDVTDSEYQSALVDYCSYYEISDIETCEKIVTRDFGSTAKFREQVLMNEARELISESTVKIDTTQYYKNKHDGKYELTESDVLDFSDTGKTGEILMWVLAAACVAAVALIAVLAVRLAKAKKSKKAHEAEIAALEEKRRIRREIRKAKKKHNTETKEE